MQMYTQKTIVSSQISMSFGVASLLRIVTKYETALSTGTINDFNVLVSFSILALLYELTISAARILTINLKVVTFIFFFYGL